jgi:hypothetical protein
MVFHPGSESALESAGCVWSLILHFHSIGRKQWYTDGSASITGRKPQAIQADPISFMSVSLLMRSRRMPNEPAMTGPWHFSQGNAMR